MMHLTDEDPTLRLRTIGSMMRGRPPVIALPLTCSVADLNEVFDEAPVRHVALVDAAGVLRATVSRAAAEAAAAGGGLARAHSPLVLGPDRDLGVVLALMVRAHTDHVLVVSARGDLLGIVDRAEIEAVFQRMSGSIRALRTAVPA